MLEPDRTPRLGLHEAKAGHAIRLVPDLVMLDKAAVALHDLGQIAFVVRPGLRFVRKTTGQVLLPAFDQHRLDAGVLPGPARRGGHAQCNTDTRPGNRGDDRVRHRPVIRTSLPFDIVPADAHARGLHAPLRHLSGTRGRALPDVGPMGVVMLPPSRPAINHPPRVTHPRHRTRGRNAL